MESALATVRGALPGLEETAVLKTLENLRNACDYIIQVGSMAPSERPHPLEAFLPHADRIPDGSVVFVKTDMLGDFFTLAFPRIRARFVLVTAGWSWPTPGPHRRHLDDPRIIRWFGQNQDLPAPHEKFEPLPIGFTDPWLPQGNHAALLRIHRTVPAVTDKPLTAHASFHFNRSHPDRRGVLDAVSGMPHVTVEPVKLPPEVLWRRHADHAFVISPRGSGWDCHRTWEAILLRSIPIVRSSHVDPLYAGFPVAIVDDWREVTPAAMAAWRERFSDGFTAEMFERLTLRHWLGRIRQAADNGSVTPAR